MDDIGLVRRIQERVVDGLRDWRAAQGDSLPGGVEHERVQAGHLATAAIREHSSVLMRNGQPALDPDDEGEVVRAVLARMYGAGRLQKLLDDPDLADVSDININGFDRVFVTRGGGQRQRLIDAATGLPFRVAEDDAELVTQVQTLAAYVSRNSRPFDSANWALDLELSPFVRLSAIHPSEAGRPVISLRRNKFDRVFLADLVAWGAMTPELAAFARAAVLARHNIMVAGQTGSGKTTTLRALINEIPPAERLITIEASMELGIARLEDLHPDVVELEARMPNSEGVGGVSIRELVRRSLRHDPDRVIVGEVLGPEVVDMLNAMTQGNDGSLSTIHADSAPMVFDRLATYAKQAEENLDVETTGMLTAGALDWVFFVEKRPVGGGYLRRVSSVREIAGFEDGRVLSSEVFGLDAAGQVVPKPRVTDQRFAELAAAGWSEPDYSRLPRQTLDLTGLAPAATFDGWSAR